MKINVMIATPDDQMWGSSDPEAENINVAASYDRYCELVAERLQEIWPDADVAVDWDDDAQDDGISIEDTVAGTVDDDADTIEYVIQTVHGNWTWTVENDPAPAV